MRRICANEFRKPNLVLKVVKQIETKQEQTSTELLERLIELNSFIEEIHLVRFEAGPDIQIESFGQLKVDSLTNNNVALTTKDNSIKIWNLDSNKCVATLDGHSDSICCLENIDENRFASGSLDKTIKIWDAKKFLCLKTHNTGLQYGVFCLKSLPLNRIASGSIQHINIWDIDSGTCLQTLQAALYGPLLHITGLIYLPSGYLVSCSREYSWILVWDLTRSVFVKVITGHSNGVNSLVLLKNGHVASSSVDGTIKIWNMDHGECIKTLRGHSGGVCRLQVLESGELISCAEDKTIKIWNVTDGICIRTLDGHTAHVSSISVDSQNNTLISSGIDSTLKTWNLRTGECLNTSVVENVAGLIKDLIFI